MENFEVDAERKRTNQIHHGLPTTSSGNLKKQVSEAKNVRVVRFSDKFGTRLMTFLLQGSTISGVKLRFQFTNTLLGCNLNTSFIPERDLL